MRDLLFLRVLLFVLLFSVSGLIVWALHHASQSEESRGGQTNRFKCEVEQLPTSEAGLKRHYAVECAPVEITREM